MDLRREAHLYIVYVFNIVFSIPRRRLRYLLPSEPSKQKQVDGVVLQLCSACRAHTLTPTRRSSAFGNLQFGLEKTNEIGGENAFKTMLFASTRTVYRITITTLFASVCPPVGPLSVCGESYALMHKPLMQPNPNRIGTE